MKQLLKQLVKKIPIAFTQNQKYDQQTKQVIRLVLSGRGSGVDIGALKGEILDIMLRAAPQGPHFAFEPIPELYERLQQKYHSSPCTIFNMALSHEVGTASFNHVVSNPSYSGLRQRQYDRPNEVAQQITVQTDTLDRILPPEVKIDLIKIDVEGAELWVLEGAREHLQRDQPIVIFEHGLGASEFYESSPEKIYDLFAHCGYQINLMQRWLRHEPPLSLAAFQQQFYERRHYYFLAYPNGAVRSAFE